MSKIVLTLPDGNTTEVPEWALETTQGEVLDALKLLVKNAGGDEKKQKKAEKDAKELLDETKKGNKSNEEQAKDSVDAIKGLGDSMDEVKKSFEQFKVDQPKTLFDHVQQNLERDGEQFLRGIATLGEKALGIASILGGGLLSGLGYVTNALLGAGDNLNKLADSGVGFNSTFQDVGKSATEAIAGLGAVGIGFGNAADLIKASSNVVATQGFGNFQASMKFAADTSEELGMSLQGSMFAFGSALDRRQKSMDLQGVSQGRLNSTIQTTIKSQRTYSMALGVSTDTMDMFIDSMLANTGALNATLIGFNSNMRNNVMAGMEVFASGMRGLGGEAGGDIAAAFTDAASMGAIGLSESAVGYITALPSLAGPMNEYISAVQSGTLSQSDAQDMVSDLTMNLGNLSSGEKARIKSLAIIGDQNAQAMASAITQFEQSEKKMAELNKQLGTAFDMDNVQKGTNEFNKVLNQAKGAMSNAFYSLFADPEITGALRDGFKDILEIFGFAIDDTSGAAMDFGKVVKQYVPMVKSVVQGVVNVFKNMAEFFAKYINKDGFDFSGLIGGLISKAVFGLLKAILLAAPIFAAGLFAFSAGKHIAKTMIMPQAEGFAKAMFAKSGDLAKNVANTAMGFAKSMFDKGKGAGVGTWISKAGGAIKGVSDKVGLTGGEKGGVVGKVSDKLADFNKKGSKMTDSLGKSMTGGGKSGGFLKSIANSVKAFGDNKVVKGAASLTLLGGALMFTAIGLKKFNEVDFTSLLKGGAALYGLNEIAKRIGKGSTAMIKGAAAIGVLGASLLPMAFALNLMNDVGLGTLVVLAGGLTVLGIAGAAIGSFLPLMLAGAVGIAALGASIIPFAIAMNIMKDVGVETVGVMAAGLVTLGVAAAGLGLALPLMLLGSVAIGALGLALIPFGIGLNVVSGALPEFAKGMSMLSDINFLNLMLAGPALASIALGMLALSGGGLISGLLDGLGSLFGAESPFDKIAKLGYAAEPIIQMADELRNMGNTLDLFETALEDFSGSAYGDEFVKIADGVSVLSEALSNFNFTDFLKLGAMKLLMPSAAPTADAATSLPAPTSTAGAGGPQINAFGPGITPTQVNSNAVPQTGMSDRMKQMMEERLKENQAKYGDAPGGFTQTVNGKTVTNNNMTQADTGAEEENPAVQTNQLLSKLVNLQEQNNRTGKKTQRNIEGLEI